MKDKNEMEKLLQAQITEYCENNDTGPNTAINGMQFINRILDGEQTMTNEDDNSKNRQPDYYVQLVTKDRNGRDRFRDVGELWEGKDNYKAGDSAAGRIVIQPREAREQLKSLRDEKQQQAKNHEHKM